jgi:hypothetical protein
VIQKECVTVKRATAIFVVAGEKMYLE